jgi:hypothetical protein
LFFSGIAFGQGTAQISGTVRDQSGAVLPGVDVQGPSTWAFDLSLSRTFRLYENQRLEVRAEAYNVTNSFRPSISTSGSSLLGASLNSSTFGQIHNSLDPRVMQFPLKYVF